jgi:hypothetical protein
MAASPKTTSTSRPEISLLDTPNYKTRTWYLVYHHREPYRWWTNFLEPGFRHVELTRPLYYGPGVNDVGWLNVLPTFEMLDIELSGNPTPPWVRCPDSTVQKVTGARLLTTLHTPIDLGPVTCVSIAKAMLGIRAFWVKTPYQLYKFLKKRGGVVISG